MPTIYRHQLLYTILILVVLCAYYYSNTDTDLSNFSARNSGRRILSTFRYRKPKNVRMFEKQYAAIPQWARDYIAWHSIQRKYHLNDPSTRFLTVACHNPGFCGGISDRLKSMPYYIEVANQTRRVLFIKWQKYNLEDFLLPREGSLDWRLPDGIDIGSKPDATSHEIKEVLDNPKHPLNRKKNLIVQANTNLYNPKNFITEERPTGLGSYSNIMDLLFVPIPALTMAIRKAMDSLGLINKQYVAAHYRTLADSHTEVNDKSIAESHRAIDCAVQTAGNDTTVPIYFAASKTKFVEYILKDSPYARQRNPPVKVVGLDNLVRLHSDKTGIGYNDPRDLYPAFVDLWLLKYSKCVSYGHLGFGKFGHDLSGEDCGIHHIHYGLGNKCPSVVS